MSSHHVLAAVSRRYDLSFGKESEVQDAADLVLLARTIQIMAANEHITLKGPGFEENLRHPGRSACSGSGFIMARAKKTDAIGGILSVHYSAHWSNALF